MWAEAVKHAIWLKNRTSTRALGSVTPYEKLYGEKPNFMDVPEWGETVWVHTKKGSKLDARGLQARWVGYDTDSTHAHRIYWPNQNKITVERDVKFPTRPKFKPPTTTTSVPSSVPPSTVVPPLAQQLVPPGSFTPQKQKQKVAQPIEPTRRSTRITKPSYYLRCIEAGEGTAEGSNVDTV
ncbi:hypothetical protein BC827DRAFT_1149047, partial [Russula dissimulans]